jgi:hypothetical protein
VCDQQLRDGTRKHSVSQRREESERECDQQNEKTLSVTEKGIEKRKKREGV